MQNESVTRVELLKLLDDLDAVEGEWLTVFLRRDSIQPQAGRAALLSPIDERVVSAAAVLEDDGVQRAVERYGTGLVVFQSPGATHVVVPPFPVLKDSARLGSPETGPLRQLMEQRRRVAFVLVTWGAYVAGLFEGLQYVAHKQGTGHIHKHTKKGGSSQARYQRRTQGQRAEFLRRAGGHIDDVFGAEEVEHLFFGGNRLILRPLTEECDFVRRHLTVLSPRTLLVKRATLASLDGALGQAYSSECFRS
jgi:hypothetical protein